jgi:hypothetical protein
LGQPGLSTSIHCAVPHPISIISSITSDVKQGDGNLRTGTYKFPPDQAAKIAGQTIRSTPTAVEHVRLVAFDQPARDVLQAALNA